MSFIQCLGFFYEHLGSVLTGLAAVLAVWKAPTLLSQFIELRDERTRKNLHEWTIYFVDPHKSFQEQYFLEENKHLFPKYKIVDSVDRLDDNVKALFVIFYPESSSQQTNELYEFHLRVKKKAEESDFVVPLLLFSKINYPNDKMRLLREYSYFESCQTIYRLLSCIDGIAMTTPISKHNP
jgi:hypothetical protein